MANELNYKNILNSFVDRSKSYTMDVKNRLNTLSLDYSMGLTEEFMLNRNFTTGTIGDGMGQLVGIPSDIFERLVTYYNDLKNSITAETTTIQTKFYTLDPTVSEKNYVKKVLITHLEKQFSDITNEVNKTINSFREQQLRLVNNVDTLNFVTNIRHDGQFLNRSGGRVASLILTATTQAINLTTSYNDSNSHLKNYLNNYVLHKFNLNYPYGGEYIYFNNLIYTKELHTLSFSGNFTPELNTLINSRKDMLYEDLLKIDNNQVNGLNKTLSVRFRKVLLQLFKGWVRYDISLVNDRIFSGLEHGFTLFNNNIKNYVTNFPIGYSLNTGNTAQNIVRNYLVDKNRGTDDSTFNNKLITQLYVG
tara:strand:+ start:1086 stop:2174 length:1089 start_codon:yes stop_codon:yes gene_type:complete